MFKNLFKVGLLLVLGGMAISSARAETKFLDTDNDGLTDFEERAIYQTFWYSEDTDRDGYPDGLDRH